MSHLMFGNKYLVPMWRPTFGWDEDLIREYRSAADRHLPFVWVRGVYHYLFHRRTVPFPTSLPEGTEWVIVSFFDGPPGPLSARPQLLPLESSWRWINRAVRARQKPGEPEFHHPDTDDLFAFGKAVREYDGRPKKSRARPVSERFGRALAWEA